MTFLLLGLFVNTTMAQDADDNVQNGTVVDNDTWDGAPVRLGVFGGLNGNIVGAGAQQLNLIGTQGNGTLFDTPNNDGTVNTIDGTALGYYFGGMFEYNSGGLLGAQLRASVDDRRVHFNNWDLTDPAAEPRFSARMTYLSVEPMLRVNLGNPDFHLTAGPLLSWLINASYDYTPGRDETTPAISGQKLNDAKSFAYGVSGGLGYDIMLNDDPQSSTRWYLTPFAEASYMLDQVKSDYPQLQDRNDVWVTTTIRGGLQLKFGMGAETAPEPVVVTETHPAITLAVRAPSTIVTQREMREYFPIRNYMFFDKGQTSIPNEYVQLSPSAAQSFADSNLLNPPATGDLADVSSNRSSRQMTVYYNIMNVVGSRMQDNPGATISLVGSAPVANDARLMAGNVRDYLVNTFGIDPSRINVSAQTRPPHPSGDASTPKEDLDLVAQENDRVEIQSDDPAILKPVEIRSMQSAAADNDVTLSVNTVTQTPIDSWTVHVTGNGFDRTYGPYQGSMTETKLAGEPILGTNSSGTYTATVTARTTSGETVSQTENFQLARLAEPPVTDHRFSILYEFNQSTTLDMYEDFLRNTVAPQVPANATVVIHGHTDVVGTEDRNLKLSEDRAQSALNVLKTALAGKNVTFDSYGFGETPMRAPFGNDSPEGRYYNRTVVIEVVPSS